MWAETQTSLLTIFVAWSAVTQLLGWAAAAGIAREPRIAAKRRNSRGGIRFMEQPFRGTAISVLRIQIEWKTRSEQRSKRSIARHGGIRKVERLHALRRVT